MQLCLDDAKPCGVSVRVQKVTNCVDVLDHAGCEYCTECILASQTSCLVSESASRGGCAPQKPDRDKIVRIPKAQPLGAYRFRNIATCVSESKHIFDHTTGYVWICACK